MRVAQYSPFALRSSNDDAVSDLHRVAFLSQPAVGREEEHKIAGSRTTLHDLHPTAEHQLVVFGKLIGNTGYRRIFSDIHDPGM